MNSFEIFVEMAKNEIRNGQTVTVYINGERYDFSQENNRAIIED